MNSFLKKSPSGGVMYSNPPTPDALGNRSVLPTGGSKMGPIFCFADQLTTLISRNMLLSRSGRCFSMLFYCFVLFFVGKYWNSTTLASIIPAFCLTNSMLCPISMCILRPFPPVQQRIESAAFRPTINCFVVLQMYYRS